MYVIFNYDADKAHSHWSRFFSAVLKAFRRR